ncbi:MAG: 1-deoxy-D-xylulose-5-phosphate reductoisomerase [Candidatus Neomarinimicrobiota bacterium]|nr:1-deoxy-D-xylulose-5-phosphate reductoisomerase [Candidatus Neomarinimicrobiota bacterium]|tara:strand:- start:6157 stop:7302 length:1146 start_codon:yes stop_codon:yes gene_type:complete
MRKRISILGSTGSIGLNALEVVRHLTDRLDIVYLSANKNTERMVEQCREFHPEAVVMNDEEAAEIVYNKVNKDGIDVLSGREGLIELAGRKDVELMLNGLVGALGMEPTLEAVLACVDVALSNKESLVMAGDIITKTMKKTGARLFPVDSEHSAIWQCLAGESLDDVRRIILTGSGGPFRSRAINTFVDVTIEEALNHPNWDMGKKITIDSATMMNKGLEVIEAFWLFRLDVSQVDIIVHPQSIIHSMIELKDGSIKAQLGVPDMKVPIQYALMYPRHVDAHWERLDFTKCGDLTFQPPDLERFPCIKLAFDAIRRMGTTPAVLNLSNDYAVYRFLDGKIRFTDIPRIIESAIEKHEWLEDPSLNDLKILDKWTKLLVENF